MLPGDVATFLATLGVNDPPELSGLTVLDATDLVVMEHAANVLLTVDRITPSTIGLYAGQPNATPGFADGFPARFAFTAPSQVAAAKAMTAASTVPAAGAAKPGSPAAMSASASPGQAKGSHEKAANRASPAFSWSPTVLGVPTRARYQAPPSSAPPMPRVV